MSKFCYWSVADGDHGRMFKTVIASARRHGVEEDFHLWTDINVPGAQLHDLGKLNKDRYLFKLKYLNDKVRQLGYDYFVWLDADTYFVRHPGSFDGLLRDNGWFVQMESDCTSKFVTRSDWWGCPIRWYVHLMRHFGVNSEKVYNCNAGFWIVRKDAICDFYAKAMEFYEYCREELHLVNFTEEPPLAFKGVLPNGNEWRFRDYMSMENWKVNPAIVHCMRSKEALIRAFDINWT